MFIKGIKAKSSKHPFTFKPRERNAIISSNSNNKNYEVIITNILNTSQIPQHPSTEVNIPPLVIKPCNTSRLSQKSLQFPKKKQPKCNPSDYDEQIDFKLTTTKYVTTYHRSIFIPTVIAVLPNKGKTNAFVNKEHKIEKKKSTTLYDERVKRLITRCKGSEKAIIALSEPTAALTDSHQYGYEKEREREKGMSFNIEKLSEELNELTNDLHIVHHHHSILNSDCLGTSTSTSSNIGLNLSTSNNMIKSSSNNSVLNEIRSKHKFKSFKSK